MIPTRSKSSLADEVALKGLTSIANAPVMSPIEQESVTILVLHGIADQLKKLEVLSQDEEASSEEKILNSFRGLLGQVGGSLSKNDMDQIKLRLMKAESKPNIDKLTLEGLQKAAEELLVKIEENTSSMSKKKKLGIFGSVAGIVCLVVPFLAPSTILGIAFGSNAVHDEKQLSSLSKDIKKALEGLSNEEKAVVYKQLIVMLTSFSVEAPVMSNMSAPSSQMSPFSVPAEEEKEEENDSLYLDLRNALNTMVGSLESNKTDTAKYHSAKSELSLAMDKLYTDLLQDKHEELERQVEENAATRAKQNKTSKIAKFFSYLTMAITVAITAVFSPATAVIMATVLILSTVPVNSNGDTTLGLFSNELAKVFEAMGASEEVAAFLANLTVVIITTVATRKVCTSTNNALQAAGRANTIGPGQFGPLTRTDSMKYGVFSGSMTELAFVSSVGYLGLTSSFFEMFEFEDEGKQKTYELVTQIVGIAEQVVASLWTGKTTVSMGAFDAATFSAKNAYTSAQWMNLMNILTGIGSGATNIASGSYMVQMGNLAYIMREIEAEMAVLNQAVNSNARGQKDDERKQKDITDAHAAMTESYSKLSSHGRALAEAMA